MLEQTAPAFEIQAPAQLTVRLVKPLTGASRASFLLSDGDGRVWLAASDGVNLPAGQSLQLAPGVASEVFSNRRPLLIADLGATGFPSHPDRGYTTASCMAVPVAWNDRFFGVLCAADHVQASPFTPQELSSLQMLADQVGACLGAVGSARALAYMDSLTGIQSRRAFDDRLEEEVERSRRTGTPISLLLLDVDNLKQVNDLGGHLAGDEVLRTVARAISGTVRRMDQIARFGGDEFVVLLPDTVAAHGVQVAQRLSETLSRLSVRGHRGITFSINASIGVATLPPAGSGRDLVDQADRAMYTSKQSGEGVRHWMLEETGATDMAYWCSCRNCQKSFRVQSLREQRARGYCSPECAAAARRQKKAVRNAAIRSLRRGGLTLRAIAQRFGITEERVRQICEAGAPVAVVGESMEGARATHPQQLGQLILEV